MATTVTMPIAAKGARVLCVDDEPNILRSLRWLLQKQFQVDVAGSGPDALTMLRGADYDVVVSDQRMPGMTGAELLREVRKVAPRAMRILLTGYSDTAAIVASVNEGEVFRFAQKPWSGPELLGAVAEAAAIARQAPVLANVPEAHSDSDFETDGDSILVIEDDPAVCGEVRQTIGTSAPVICAHDLAEAVAALAEHPVGTVLSNLRVGQVDASRMIKLLKAEHPGVVTIVYTDADDAVDVIGLINEAQVFRVLPKPIKPTLLRRALAAAATKRRQLKQSPESGRRHAVQPLPEEARAALGRDIERAARARSGGVRAASDRFLERLGSGLRRLFGRHAAPAG